MFVHLQKIYDKFFQLFANSQLSEDEYNLSSWEEEILVALIQRKYYYKISAGEMALPKPEKVARINEILNSRSNKRPEECYKFVLTRVNKYLKKKFCQRRDLKCKSDVAFYEFYFGDAAKKAGIPIDSFFYPLTRKPKNGLMFNNDYFYRIFQSEQFLHDLYAYIEKELYTEYIQEIKHKLISLLTRYDIMFEQNLDKKAGLVHKIKEYLLKNKRCKLPWTVKEIGESIQRFYLLLEQFKPSEALRN